MSGERCSPTKALNLLMPTFSAMAAAAELTRAIHDNRCRPYCYGAVAHSNLIPWLMVVAQPENDGRWTAHIQNSSIAVTRPLDVWEFEIDEVKALLAAEGARAAAASTTIGNPRRGKPGPQPKDDWPEEVKAEIVRIALSDPKALRNIDGLNEKIRTRFRETDRWLPNDAKETKKIIREFIQRLRNLTPP